MKLRYPAASAAVLALTFAIAPVAHATSGSPLDCGAGVAAVKGGYQLTRDVACGFTWSDSHKFLDLHGHTLTGAIVTTGDHLTFRNGTLLTDGSYLASDNVTLSHLKVRSPTPVLGFLIEAGNNFIVEHSSFENIDAPVALDFYFGTTGRITSSTFTGNSGAAISVQAANDVDIEHNSFSRNGVGVNLWPEDMVGVNRITVSNNTFDSNVNAGLSIHGFIENGGLDAARVEGDTITATGGPGIEIALTCFTGDDCTAPHMSVSRNHLLGNGTATSDVDSRSGMFARAYSTDGETNVDTPAYLVGVQVTANHAEANGDLGFDVPGVTDGGNNHASSNANPLQCVGVSCQKVDAMTRMLTIVPPNLNLSEVAHHHS